jgi:hypothetical protein
MTFGISKPTPELATSKNTRPPTLRTLLTHKFDTSNSNPTTSKHTSTSRTKRSMTANKQPGSNVPQWTSAALRASYRHTYKVFKNPLLRVKPLLTTGSQGCHIVATVGLAMQPPNSPILNLQHGTWKESCYRPIHLDTGENMEYKQLLTSSDVHI